MYVKSTQYQLWGIIQNGDIPITKPEEEYGPNEYDILERNTKARFMITSSLTKSLFYKFKNHNNAKDLWKALEITYEGTDDVKLRKAATLQRQYEMFAMMDGESIDDMHGRFQVIVNELLALGTQFSNAQNNMKILDSLTTPWQNFATSITVNRDMKTASIDELIGALKAHEIHLAQGRSLRATLERLLKQTNQNVLLKKSLLKEEARVKSLRLILNPA